MKDAHEPGVPLAHYLEQHPDTGVRFTCLGCMAIHDVPMDRVLARLKETGKGDETTGIKSIGQRSAQPCERCRKVAWDTGPAWHAFCSPPSKA